MLDLRSATALSAETEEKIGAKRCRSNVLLPPGAIYPKLDVALEACSYQVRLATDVRYFLEHKANSPREHQG